MRRIRAGEALMGVGAAALFALLFAQWFDVHAPRGAGRFLVLFGHGLHRSGWSSLGWAAIALLVIVIVLALVALGAVVVGAKPAIAVGSAVATVTIATMTVLVILVRVLITQPDLGVGLPNSAVSVQVAGYLGLGALALIAVGAWITIADERTDAPESASTPPPPRPLPHG